MPDTCDTRVEERQQEPPRKPESGATLPARPVKGEIDYAELIRDTMRRFPKILAALAK